MPPASAGHNEQDLVCQTVDEFVRIPSAFELELERRAYFCPAVYSELLFALECTRAVADLVYGLRELLRFRRIRAWGKTHGKFPRQRQREFIDRLRGSEVEHRAARFYQPG